MSLIVRLVLLSVLLSVIVIVAYSTLQNVLPTTGILKCEIKNTTSGENVNFVLKSGHRMNGCRLNECIKGFLLITKPESKILLTAITVKDVQMHRMEFTVLELGHRMNRFNSYNITKNLTATIRFTFSNCAVSDGC